MIIKKFQGKTEEEATENARKELGADVVIMNVRTVKKKGLFAWFSAPVVEVTGAVEEESERYPLRRGNDRTEKSGERIAPAPKPTFDLKAGTAADGQPQPAVKREEPAVERRSGEAARTTAGIGRVTAAESKESAPGGVYDHGSREMGAIEEKLDNLQTLIQQQIKPQEGERTQQQERTASPREAQEEKSAELVRFMKLLYNIMLENEIEEKYINQMMEEIEKVHKPGMPFDYALANTYQKMILKFGQTAQITPASKGPKVIFFVGPTGVGKTTTIAKIASRFSLEDKKKVALLTADTYRIAAAEQLRTYANILEVPFRVIYTVEELETSIADFKNFDYLFVDTAGHSHQNVAQKEAMSAFVHCVDGLAEKDVFLVLSATTKYRDLISISDSYKEMADYKLIFTKLDETTALGNLLNLRLYTGASLAYVTCGQNVPDDIEQFNPQKTVKQLLGRQRSKS